MSVFNDFVLKSISIKLGLDEQISIIPIDFSIQSSQNLSDFNKIIAFCIPHKGVKLYTSAHESSVRNSIDKFLFTAFNKTIYEFEHLCEHDSISFEHKDFIKTTLMTIDYPNYCLYFETMDLSLLSILMKDFHYEMFENYKSVEFTEYYDVYIKHFFNYVTENKDKYVKKLSGYAKISNDT